MYNLHLKEEIETLRIFEENGSYEARSTPIFSCTVHYISDKEVYMCNAVGVFSRHIMRVIKNHFKTMGYEKATYERKGCIKGMK